MIHNFGTHLNMRMFYYFYVNVMLSNEFITTKNICVDTNIIYLSSIVTKLSWQPFCFCLAPAPCLIFCLAPAPCLIFFFYSPPPPPPTPTPPPTTPTPPPTIKRRLKSDDCLLSHTSPLMLSMYCYSTPAMPFTLLC